MQMSIGAETKEMVKKVNKSKRKEQITHLTLGKTVKILRT
jgi:hypothetical protein